MLPLILSLWLAQISGGGISPERLIKAGSEPQNWLTYSGNLLGHRYSPLAQVTTANVAQLQVKWAYQFPLRRTEVSPLVVDGVMYISSPEFVAALDAGMGREYWKVDISLPADLQTIGFGRVNRGPAILGDLLYVATLDCRLLALDTRTGAIRWEVRVADYKPGYSMTVAPLAVPGLVITGVSGGEAGIRGFIDAYDAATGKRAWRFYTIPGPGEFGHDTWSGDAWKTGGGSTWVTGVFDPELDLIYWGVGNPGPDWNGDVRPGDNLFTCSFVALDRKTGQRQWHFQFTPHDTHDWDATHTPMLVNAMVRGKMRKLIVSPNRNGFYYVLDRETGEFLSGTTYVKQTWARGLDDKGRPQLIPGTDPTEEGVEVWPSLNGGTVWYSPAYSPLTQFVYVAAREKGSVYFKREAEFKPGTFFAGGGEREVPRDQQWGAIRALELTTGKQKWEFKLVSPPWAGVMATAGNLVFGGSNEGDFFALNATTGAPLWRFPSGGPIAANPVAFAVNGQQRIAIAADRVLFVFGLPER
jgi:alcohol dehydrogenase (cytochrome c)